MKRLELLFKNMDDKNVTISLDDPIEPVNPTTVSQVMDEIIAQNVFTSTGGDLVSKHGARVVERNVTEIEIEF
jgi:uncharacterized protein YggL (DUF469 family)